MKFSLWIRNLERKLWYWPSKAWEVQDSPLRRYKRFKNEISTRHILINFPYLKKISNTDVRVLEILWHILIELTKTETRCAPRPPPEGVQYYRLEHPPVGVRGNLWVHTRVDDALPGYAKKFEKSISVIEKHSKFEN